ILLESVSNNFYLGLYYPHANCGDTSTSSVITAKMLALVDTWPDEDALLRTVENFPRLRITQIGEQDFVKRGLHNGPSIEPISE
ncbi:MAG TPA: hypothetical protein VFT59_01020, partial [Candidatus Saccharimonadales bacterium]|nr:hypothetical protein [Candidatus Saccharimonadales bacterium]